MARPIRCRRICGEPAFDRFAPCGAGGSVEILLTLDEFEAIRLIDYQRQSHEQCARQMEISRTTATEIYERARAKIADCLVNGRTLRIAGGNYRLCGGTAGDCCGHRCGKTSPAASPATGGKEAQHMKIAVTYENGNVFPHFGHTAQFKIYEAAEGAVTASQVVSTNGSGHGALAGLLASLQVDTLICGGIGAGAQAALAEAGIRLYGGVSGDADAAVNALLAGQLAYDPDARCDHHEGGHHCGHQEAGHGCGEDKHGCAGNGGCH